MTEACYGECPVIVYLFVCEVFQLSIQIDWAHNMLKDMCLSLFYLTIKLYLWGQSCQFTAAKGHFECILTKGFLSDLAWTEWLTGSLLETSNPHISLCSHTGQYITRLSLVQSFSFTKHSHRCNCSTVAWRKLLIKSSHVGGPVIFERI